MLLASDGTNEAGGVDAVARSLGRNEGSRVVVAHVNKRMASR